MSKAKEFAKIYRAVVQKEKAHQQADLERKRRQEYIRQQQNEQVANNEENNKEQNSTASTQRPNDKKILPNNSLKLKDKEDIKIFKPIKITLIAYAVIFVVSFLLLMTLFIVINSFIWGEGGSGGSSTIGTTTTYTQRCAATTVKMPDDSTATYDARDYVAGVVAAEVGGFRDAEVYKAFAIAARTYGEYTSTNCTINGDATAQSFRDISGSNEEYAKMIYQAVDDTDGVVLMTNNQIFMSQYDAFACIDEDDNYYTIAQAEQKIPKSFIDSRIDRNNPRTAHWFNCDGRENLKEHHGNGMSQYGALYLATEKKYNYKQILGYYYKNAKLSSKETPHITTVTGLSIKDTTNAKELHESLASFLPSRGSSVDDLKNSIKNNVERVGVGTREGVVTAAVSLVNFLYDNAHVKLPYYWGGEYQQVGMNPSFGGRTTPKTSTYGTTFYYAGFDCSGFVSWAIRNGGYKFSRHTTVGFNDRFANDSCIITDANCKGQPGDLINSRSTHVQLIVSVDEANGKYYVVESTGSAGLIMHQWGMHSPNTNKDVTRILHMDNFYNDKANVDQNY